MADAQSGGGSPRKRRPASAEDGAYSLSKAPPAASAGIDDVLKGPGRARLFQTADRPQMAGSVSSSDRGSYHDRRLADRMRDPEFRDAFLAASTEMSDPRFMRPVATTTKALQTHALDAPTHCACGSELSPLKVPGRHRIWCSERCRKVFKYGATCRNCGGYRDGTTPGKSKGWCAKCAPAMTDHSRREDVVRARVRRQTWVSLWKEGCSLRDLAKVSQMPLEAVSVEIAHMRRDGWDMPYRYNVNSQGIREPGIE